MNEDRTPVIIGVGQFAEAPNQSHYRALSPVELADALIARVEALDRQFDAFLLPTPEKARE